MSSFRRILVGWDCSHDAVRAVRLATDLADELHGEVVVVSVLRPPAHAETAEARDQQLAAMREYAEVELLAHTARPSGGTGTLVHHTALEAQDPAAAIDRYADEHSCDLIVIGRHGVDQAVHPRAGGVAERLVRRSSTPVLLVGDE